MCLCRCAYSDVPGLTPHDHVKYESSFLTTLCFCTFFFCFLSFFNRFTKIFFVFLFWQVYPDKNHGILGINTRRHLFSTIEDFLTECNEGYSTKFGRLPEVKEGK